MEGKASCQYCSGSGAVRDFNSGETTACPCSRASSKKRKGAPTLEELEPFIRKIVREELKRCE